MNKIPLPTIGEILREEFLEPLNLSAYAVAKGIDVPTSRIQDLLHDRRKITVDTSVRLGRFFGLSDRYFLNLQNDIDIRKAEETYNYDKIKKYQLA
ncbi:HigA family addiction module antitoxin [Lactobacillus jensenii]|jgi:addiction module antidote protein HigA|uniref:HigA family addiction module antidote protein n=1 Tax=Lactobacillus jensenii TaxID=109790 RepID=A0A5N1ICR1_LACJE|nr:MULTISPECIES: HigA family addiction module antitoxin [Lactobacillus]ERJ43221.1 toxin-antitoxin system antitoxin subunit [Lactobacillus jensenii MD IIE-70(2)]APT14021.1 addiction module antidote protein, HigA family [Lactobacillus jensenii]EEQ23938.1 addiction module antidote protein HigA [Lactobacillus jensenii 269-3]KAA9235659.1 HigA family addiction module antidote protein [Lactobacillus jensenii]KAA9259612.1 HigA family addiction module antidote protein [Lactobacillus jensenii]